MADTKVSALIPATTLNTADYLLLVQGGNSLKIDIQTLFHNIPTRLIILEASESPASGVLATGLLVSKLTTSSGVTAYTLPAGTHGMEKNIVIGNATGGGSATLTISTGAAGFSVITFTALKSTLTLKNIDGLWYIMASNTVTIA